MDKKSGNQGNPSSSEKLRSLLYGKFPKETLEIMHQTRDVEYRAIIVYPESNGQSIHRNRCIKALESLVQSNYLVIVCESMDEFSFAPISNHMYRLSRGEYLLPLLRSQSVIVLCSDHSQWTWTEWIPHKWVWEVGDNDNILTKERELYSLDDSVLGQPMAWKAYANLHKDNQIHVMTKTFLDFDGCYFYNGGAERYLLDLADMAKDMGYGLTIYQYGHFSWVRRFKNVDVISLNTGDLPPLKHALHATKEFSQRFYEQSEGRSALSIYSPFYEVWPHAVAGNIGISHGVAWDNPYACYENVAAFWVMNQQYIESADHCEELVSVDTNTANWFQTVNYETGRKIQVIPNYVDLEKFYPKERMGNEQRVVILYPRQLYSARGLYLVLEILDEILHRYPQVEFRFIGRGGEGDTQHVVNKMKQWGERVKWDALSLDEMPDAYRDADITLIPTLFSEGTSLSCLEAMASGNAVIATRIGGLTDLVINQYNGDLIEPHADALLESISSLLADPQRLKLYQRRAVEVAQAFSKTRWNHKWTRLVKEKINIQDRRAQPAERLIEFRLDRLPDDFSQLGKRVCSCLIRGDMVYIRVKDLPANHDFSFGRIQWLGWDEPTFTEPDEIVEVVM